MKPPHRPAPAAGVSSYPVVFTLYPHANPIQAQLHSPRSPPEGLAAALRAPAGGLPCPLSAHAFGEDLGVPGGVCGAKDVGLSLCALSLISLLRALAEGLQRNRTD